MEILKKLFRKKEHEDETLFTEEDYVFQHNFKRYYVRKIHGITEFWARDNNDHRLNFYIGKLVDERVILSQAYYTHPWDVIKAGGRLIRIYLHNDDRW